MMALVIIASIIVDIKKKILALYGVINIVHIHIKIMSVVIINLDVKEVRKNEMY